MTLWGKPYHLHMQNMAELNAYDCHQNVTEPQATEYQKKSTCVYMNCEPGHAAQAAGGNDMDRWQHPSQLCS